MLFLKMAPNYIFAYIYNKVHFFERFVEKKYNIRKVYFASLRSFLEKLEKGNMKIYSRTQVRKAYRDDVIARS